MTWKADGNSIIYQGTSDKTLNVTPVVHMTLDGKEVTAADVKNASGEVAMTVSYRAESPFLAVTVIRRRDQRDRGQRRGADRRRAQLPDGLRHPRRGCGFGNRPIPSP